MDCCKPYTELISAALDGALTGEEQRRLEAHLAVCPACRALMADLEHIRAALGALPEAQPPAQLAQGVMERIRAEGDRGKVVPFPGDAARAKRPLWRQWRSLGAMAAVFAVVVVSAVGLGLNGLLAPDHDSTAGEAANGSALAADAYRSGTDDPTPGLREIGDAGAEAATPEAHSVAGAAAQNGLPDATQAPNGATVFSGGAGDPLQAPAQGVVYYTSLPQGWEELFPSVTSPDGMQVSAEDAQAFVALLEAQGIPYTAEGDLSGNGAVQLLSETPDQSP